MTPGVRKPAFRPAAVRPLPALLRHRAFIAGRRAGARPATPATAIARVLRRLAMPGVGLRIGVTLHVAQRAAPLVVTPLVAPAASVFPVVRQATTRVLTGVRDRLLHATVHRHDAVLRQTSRERVRDAIAAPAPVAMPAAPWLRRVDARPAYPPLKPVVVRHGPARHEPPRSPATAVPASFDARPAATATVTGAVQPATGWPLSPPALAQLTQAVSTQVIGQLERRALSFRERHG